MKRPCTRTSAAGLAFALACAAVTLLGCQSPAPEPAPEPRPSVSAAPETPEPPDLVQEDLVVGTGAEAKDGDKVKVSYTGRLLKTNFMFDTSVGPGKKPFEFQIGKGSVIKGWDRGVVGMKVGGKRKLTVPSRLGYGDKGQAPKIPSKATLVFEVELLSVNEVAESSSTSNTRVALLRILGAYRRREGRGAPRYDGYCRSGTRTAAMSGMKFVLSHLRPWPQVFLDEIGSSGVPRARRGGLRRRVWQPRRRTRGGLPRPAAEVGEGDPLSSVPLVQAAPCPR